jgi:hypothetical protein
MQTKCKINDWTHVEWFCELLKVHERPETSMKTPLWRGRPEERERGRMLKKRF